MNPSTEFGDLYRSALEHADWEDLEDLAPRARTVFDCLCEDDFALFTGLLRALPENTEIHPLCERMNFLSKLVLWCSEDGRMRLRANYHNPEFSDAPHNHRFTFASRIISGAYEHHIYPDGTMELAAPMRDAKPVMLRTETRGSTYVLHHDTVHATFPREATWSIMLRGPIAKQRGKVVDQATGRTVDWVSTVLEPEQQRRKKALAGPEIGAMVEQVLRSLGSNGRTGHRDYQTQP